jgi:hypothetical protein
MGETPVIDGYYSDYTDCFTVVSGVITSVNSCTSGTTTGQVFINNVDTSGGTIIYVKVNGVDIISSPGDFPVLNGQTIIGSYGPAVFGLSTVEVYIGGTIAMDAPINLVLNNGYTNCLISIGTAPDTFTGVDLSTNANITISLQPQGSSCL